MFSHTTVSFGQCFCAALSEANSVRSPDDAVGVGEWLVASAGEANSENARVSKPTSRRSNRSSLKDYPGGSPRRPSWFKVTNDPKRRLRYRLLSARLSTGKKKQTPAYTGERSRKRIRSAGRNGSRWGCGDFAGLVKPWSPSLNHLTAIELCFERHFTPKDSQATRGKPHDSIFNDEERRNPVCPRCAAGMRRIPHLAVIRYLADKLTSGLNVHLANASSGPGRAFASEALPSPTREWFRP